MSLYRVAQLLTIYEPISDREIRVRIHTIDLDSPDTVLQPSVYMGLEESVNEIRFFTFSDDMVISQPISTPFDDDDIPVQSTLVDSEPPTSQNFRSTGQSWSSGSGGFTASGDLVFERIARAMEIPLARRRIVSPPHNSIALPGTTAVENFHRDLGRSVNSRDYTPTEAGPFVNFVIIPRLRYVGTASVRRGANHTLDLIPSRRELGTGEYRFCDNMGRIWYNAIQFSNINLFDANRVSIYVDVNGIKWLLMSEYYQELNQPDADERGYNMYKKKNIRKKYGSMPTIKSEDHYAGKNYIA